MDSALLPTALHTQAQLSSLPFSDLERLKCSLDTLRQQVLALQNAYSPLLRLPGELRNQIFHHAMYAELDCRCIARTQASGSRREHFFADPRFLSTCRQIRDECISMWFSEVVVWEEWESSTECWRRLGESEVRELQVARSKLGRCRLVTQMAFCSLEKTKEAVVGSGSVCPRRGVARVEGIGSGLPGMRWWMW